MTYLTDAADFVAAQKLELAARNLLHILKIQQEQVTIDRVVSSIQQTMVDAHANNPTDLCDMMVTQARIMDSLFHFYLDESKGQYTEHDKIATAMKANAQTVRTLHAWKKLKEENYIKRKIIGYSAPEEKNTRNELDNSESKHAALDT